MKHIGMYIHIPFCKKKCDYCDFGSFDDKTEKVDDYISCIKQELQEVGEGITMDAKEGINDFATISTIYIGGGTPSFIDSKYIEEIIETIKKYYTLDEQIEITIEINPGTATKEKLENYKKVGINRCSIGMQATSDELLKELGRIHNVDEFIKTYELARKVGFKNINIDFMIGLPKQEMKDIEKVIEIIKKLEPEHVSVYSLILEEDTKLKEKIDNGILALPSDELERKMYWYIKQNLEAQNYEHYEISNFAKKGYESRHNLDCWEQKEYIGFGSSAHSYTDNVRYSNIADIDGYIENYKIDKIEDNIIFHEKQNFETKMREYMILGLRKIGGVNKDKFNEKFAKDVFYIFKDEIQKLVKQGLIEIENDNIKLTEKGIDFANIVWQEFV